MAVIFNGAARAFCLALLASTSIARAADVSYDRLKNPEPRNWLTNHGDYGAHRYSALDRVNRGNVGGLKMAFSVAIGGDGAKENLVATPVVDDGFMYMPDAWGNVYKIDVRSGKAGRVVWKMNPGQQKIDRNRGVALWGNLVISVTSGDARVVATDRDTGKVVWDKKLDDQRDLTLNAAPLAIEKTVMIGASGGDQGVRDWVAALDAKTGAEIWRRYSIPAPGEPGSETWKDKNNAWQTGGGAFYATGSYDPASNIAYWGAGNPTPKYDSSYRPGDNLFTDSALALDADTGKILWFHQYTPNDTMDYDEIGSHVLLDGKFGGADRKLVVHAGRNGFEYAFDRGNGQFLKATQYVPEATWTKGIDAKTGRPVDYDPAKDIQTYAAPVSQVVSGARATVCPAVPGGSNFWPPSYSEQAKILFVPEVEGCSFVLRDQTRHVPGKFEGGSFGYDSRVTSGVVALDPFTGEIRNRVKMDYPNTSGALTTAGGLVFTALLDGTVMALDDKTLETLWSVNVGTGVNAPPMTYEVDGKQYVAIATGLTGNQVGRLSRTPELQDMAKYNTMLFVFGL